MKIDDKTKRGILLIVRRRKLHDDCREYTGDLLLGEWEAMEKVREIVGAAIIAEAEKHISQELGTP